MAACCWDLSVPLVIICLGITITAQPITSPPVTLSPAEGFVFHSEDYDQDDHTANPTTQFVPRKGVEKCNYKPCLENQPPCSVLAASTGCLCPGLTLNNVPPEAPDLRSVTCNGSDVLVQWCAPLSFVSGYVVTVGGQDKHKFRKEMRSGSIGKVDNVVQVCISAVNDAGESGASCTMYQPTDSSIPLKAGLIGGALGLLLLLMLVVLVWRRRQRKQEANMSLGDTAHGL